jgi:hypothetical protein
VFVQEVEARAKGLKFRIAGIAGQVINKIGGVAQQIAGRRRSIGDDMAMVLEVGLFCRPKVYPDVDEFVLRHISSRIPSSRSGCRPW